MSAPLSPWDLATAEAPDGGLLQSEAWGRFQQRLGRRLEYITVQGVQTLVVEHRLPLGFSYLYSPRGPIIHGQGFHRISQYHISPELVEGLIREVERRFPHAVFWRNEPPYETFQVPIPSFQILKAPRDVQPRTTLVVELTKNESDLLAAMKQKTRYNIGLAERRGVTVRSLEHSGDLTAFVRLLGITAERDQFSLHPVEYYRTMFAALAPEHLELFIAEYQGVMLAAALVAFFGSWAYYLHGGSSSEHRDLMAPQLLHWEIIRTAKFRGATHYDFWGIDEQRWPGVTRFKLGFAPNQNPTHYAGTWDIVFRPWLYRAYRLKTGKQ